MYVIFDDQSFSDTCTNDVVKFEQLGLGKYLVGFLVEKGVLSGAMEIIPNDSFLSKTISYNHYYNK